MLIGWQTWTEIKARLARAFSSTLVGVTVSSSEVQAWNNFVFLSDPSAHEKGSTKWAAATAKEFMGLANNGGLNSCLTSTWEMDAQDFIQALSVVGAHAAARQLGRVLEGIGRPLPPSSQQERWDILERYWTDDLDQFDVLSDEADAELLAALEASVRSEEDFYRTLGNKQTQDFPPIT